MSCLSLFVLYSNLVTLFQSSLERIDEELKKVGQKRVHCVVKIEKYHSQQHDTGERAALVDFTLVPCRPAR